MGICFVQLIIFHFLVSTMRQSAQKAINKSINLRYEDFKLMFRNIVLWNTWLFISNHVVVVSLSIDSIMFYEQMKILNLLKKEINIKAINGFHFLEFIYIYIYINFVFISLLIEFFYCLYWNFSLPSCHHLPFYLCFHLFQDTGFLPFHLMPPLSLSLWK